MTTDHKRLVAEARMFAEARGDRRDTTIVNRLADALEAACVDRAVVEAQALEQAAEAIELYQVHPVTVDGQNVVSFREGATKDAQDWLRAPAVEIREGRQ